ncbi:MULTISPECIES: hypothetical protein [Sphingobium]|uniref:hypothetical protein n=1 Tax=Sphingobium TaxID=165695 RepID=UPI0009348BBF|nr:MULTISPECIES: hypothetical protein [Sphingobium]
MEIVPINGWVLNRIVQLDFARPGFAGSYLRASAERRQVIAAFLAAVRVGREKEGEAAAILATADHRSILAHAFGKVPLGLRRALAKSGPQPYDPAYYRDLHTALACGPQHVVTAIMQSCKLGPDSLSIITMLPPDICDHRIIHRIEGRQQAEDLALVVSMMAARGIKRSEFVGALLKSKRSLKKVVQHWALQIPFAPPPIPEADGYRPIRNGAELRRTALRYQNCSRRYMTDSIGGANAFAEYTDADGRQALLCLEKRDGTWTVDGVYVRRNRQVPGDLNETVRQFAARYGILERRHSERKDDATAALKRFTRSIFDW